MIFILFSFVPSCSDIFFLNFVNINHFSNVESERKKSNDHARQFVHLIKKEKKRRREGKKKKGQLVLSSFY